MKHLGVFLLTLFSASAVMAQAPGVPVYAEGRGARPNAALMEQAKKLQGESVLLSMTKATEQALRSQCDIALPPADTKPLSARERWQRARQSHIRVGQLYLCSKCERWHLDLAGGYAVTADGAVATCAHVIAPPPDMKEGWLVAADEDDVLLPVTEVLACNVGTDSAIIRVKSEKPLTALPMGFDVSPGDSVWCFSDPGGKRGYYSEGIVSRFVRRPFMRKKEAEKLPEGVEVPKPVWLETTTDWAPGSSGSAIIDQFGNCVGHVSEIQTVVEEPLPVRRKKGETSTTQQLGTQIIFHQAIGAAEVRALVKKP
ncbi:MAG: trypsin-like peptidase domain-containing protein [Prosthecobacter sp.]|jgi:serine protease Do|uniref:S1 family peptidase n=1 Tax=Prosthecobacter sp. TaxID=1965333 RepID=UPI0019F11372|nr:serine protease [Prosthecobacter sp.]MBE2282674.1 trypsin-like peptidase domain-containing protein [Prosthecobacter sp.]